MQPVVDLDRYRAWYTQFYRNIEDQIWSEIFPKTMKNFKYDYGNFPIESLGQEKHFKHVFGVGVW